MKKLYLTLAVVIVTYSSYAQWTTSGSNIFYNSGKVSIGTTSFFSGLTIQQGATDFNGIVLQASGNDRWVRLGTDGTVGVVEATYNATAGSMPLVFKSGEAERMRITANGNVGIGTINPAYMFDVNGVMRSSVTSGSNLVLSKSTGSSISFDNGSGNQAGMVEADAATNRLEFWTNTVSNTGIVERMRITNTGNVAIGTTDPQGYKLAVNGSAIATSMTVKLNSAWPDYVFKPTYRLPSLTEVKTFIDLNHRLPEMPSEAEVTKDGLNLGEIVKMQTKKIEELTLYLIEKDNEMKIAKKTNIAQDRIIKSQETKMKRIEHQLDFLTGELKKIIK